MEIRRSKLKLALGAGCALVVLAAATTASAEERTFSVASTRAADAIPEFARQAGIQIVAPADKLRGVSTPAVEGRYDTREALAMLIAGTGLHIASDDGRTVMLAADPQSGSAAGDGADGTVAALIVTAQKREENIQDVPIAISAFTEKALEEQKIEGGFDLLKAIPNVTFSKNNFSSYNFSIRGIGTKAVSVATDPGVAVEFNSSALIRNRLFEQEYFDVERVEVLRGPQGTLHGRNATAGVINVISAKPDLAEFSGWLKGEVGNYHTKRVSAMVNVPLVDDKLAVRVAGALTDRAGYDYNAATKHQINGRGLWSGRVTVGFKPVDAFRANLIWERFNEDDDRSRTGKQLCHHDAGLSQIGSEDIDNFYGQAWTTQGCKPGSLYDDAAFGTPNGLALPFVLLATQYGDPGGQIGYTGPADDPSRELVMALKPLDPYGNMMQSRDLRTINSFRDPVYRAKTDVLELNWDFDVTPQLTLSGQTAYVQDKIYSFQDYNRFNTLPIFPDTSGLYTDPGVFVEEGGPSPMRPLAPGGIYCDPQLGCSNTMAGFDVSQAKSHQFTQEFRLASDFKGPLNFAAGVNYTRYRTIEDYYVFFNIITLLAQTKGGQFFSLFNNSADITKCRNNGWNYPEPGAGFDVNSPEFAEHCIYIDPNPIESINGEGHNYFRSKNPYLLRSGAAFGEVYWQATDTLRVTAGLRYTNDRKTFTPVPTQVLLSKVPYLGGTVGRGYPENPDIKQHWGEVTGRLGLDWKPVVPFTDQTMAYAFFSRGYKGGGANPPGIGFSTEPFCLFDTYCIPADDYGSFTPPGTPGNRPFVQPLPYPLTFKPEFVNAFEVGSKNVLMAGAATLNADAFFYDYKDYQVSQIKDRTAVNENFDAKVWGLEFEGSFQPSRDLRLNATLGWEHTSIADGMKSIDIMDRTAGNPDYMVLKPFIVMPSNCIVPVKAAEALVKMFRDAGQQNTAAGLVGMCPGNFFSEVFIPLLFGNPFAVAGIDRSTYLAETNGGAGIAKELGGNELPNAPHWTVSLGAQYGFEFTEGWRATVRGDAYWQSQSWARVYNDNPYDKLHGWYNVNLSVWFERPDDDLKIELYAKNLLDKTPITDAFLNSDDTALTTNVFVLDPRLIGLSIRKGF